MIKKILNTVLVLIWVILGLVGTSFAADNQGKQDLPVIRILSPGESASYMTRSPSLAVSGITWDSQGIREVTYSVNNGPGQKAAGTEKWTTPGLALQLGINRVEVTVSDNTGKSQRSMINIYYMPDSDNDGLPDDYEGSLKKGDLIAGSDSDRDGLTNITEYLFHTNPLSGDSDKDGLRDGDETLRLHTNPLKPDSDNDGLMDGEEMTLGLSPLKADTDGDGVLDAMEKRHQVLYGEQLKGLINPADITVPFLEIMGNGVISRNTIIKDASNFANFKGLQSMLGRPVAVSTSSRVDWAKLSFKIRDNVLRDQRITDLAIFTYEPDTNKLVLLPTSYNAQTKALTAQITRFGLFGVVNTRFLAADWVAANPGAVIANGRAEIVSALDSTGSLANNYQTLLKDQNQNLADIYFNYATDIGLISTKTENELTKGALVRLSNGRVVRLARSPSLSDGITDSDKDGLPDSKELLGETELAAGPNLKLKAWTFRSNPADPDSDDDKIPDLYDSRPYYFDKSGHNQPVSRGDGPLLRAENRNSVNNGRLESRSGVDSASSSGEPGIGLDLTASFPETEDKIKGVWPVPGHPNVTSSYGPRFCPVHKKYEYHDGIDIGAPTGSMVVAVMDGVVTSASDKGDGYGNCIWLEHPDGRITFYAHLSSIHVAQGQVVKAGDKIGLVGSTGSSTGPHLHFGYHPAGITADPKTLVSPFGSQ